MEVNLTQHFQETLHHDALITCTLLCTSVRCSRPKYSVNIRSYAPLQHLTSVPLHDKSPSGRTI
jgi:hypothetical protein